MQNDNSTKLQAADFAMMAIVLIWGMHFIILKSAFDVYHPVVFNALRFGFFVPVLAVYALFNWPTAKLPRPVLWKLVRLVALGPAIYQVCFVVALDLTTSTNSSLLVATVPAWTALFSVLLGQIEFRHALMVGVVITLAGVGLVILSGDGQLAVSRDDLLGGGLLLAGTLFLALFTVRVRPIIQAYGVIRVAMWTHVLVWLSLMITAAPNFHTLEAGDFHIRYLPLFLYSGLLASILGRLFFNFGIDRLGSTRAMAYQNFNPVVTAAGAIVFLNESLTAALIFGGLLTIFGVTIVRKNALMRPREVSDAYPATPSGTVLRPRESSMD